MGLYYDSISGITYTVSEDKSFRTISGKEVTHIRKDSNTSLTALVGDKEFKRVFISNRSGNVFIYDISSVIPNFLHSVTT